MITHHLYVVQAETVQPPNGSLSGYSLLLVVKSEKKGAK